MTTYGDELKTVPQFCERYPHIYSAPHKLRWLLRQRSKNGLLESGAVIEVYNGGSRPLIFIHEPSFFEWMRHSNK